jgi:hypothetical protein
MNSREVKWNGWWGTEFLKAKENRRLRMTVSRAVACLVKIIKVPNHNGTYYILLNTVLY